VATHNSVTLTTVEGYEYSEGGTVWQDSPVFAGLSPNTLYSFYQRQKETIDTEASELSNVLEESTGDANCSVVLCGYAIIDLPNNPPQVDDVLIATLEDEDGEEIFTFKLSYVWYVGGEVQKGAENYYVVLPEDVGKTISVTIEAEERFSSTVTSLPTAAVVKIPGRTPPAALTSSDVNVTPNSIVLNSDAQYDYGYKKAGTADAITWLAKGVSTISGLTQVTEYLVYRRYAEDATYLTSGESALFAVTTTEAPPVYYCLTGNQDWGNVAHGTTTTCGTSLGDGNIQTMINHIKGHVAGRNAVINFATGRILQMTFEGSEWGIITITGTVSVQDNNNEGWIRTGAGITLRSNLTLTYGNNTTGTNAAIRLGNGSSVEVTGGHLNGSTTASRSGVTFENNTVTASLTVTGGTITSAGNAISNESPNASIILGSNPTIAGIINSRVNTITARSDFNPTTDIQLRFNTPVAGGVAVFNGASLANRFSLTGTGSTGQYALSSIGNDIYLCAGSTGTAITGTATIDNASPRIGEVLTASITGTTNAGTLRSYVWKRGATQVGVGETYTVQTADFNEQITVTISSCDRSGTIVSAATANVKKKVGPSAPDAPTVANDATDVTYNSVTLVAINGYEYSRDDEGLVWQSSNVFSGLAPSTSYNFYQRVAATADTEASPRSDVLEKETTDAGDGVLLGSVTIENGDVPLRVGTKLVANYANDNEEKPSEITYTWYADGTEIANASGIDFTEYTVAFEDLGKQISVKVSALTGEVTKTGDILSAPTASVQKTILTGSIAIASGDAPQVNTALTVSHDGNGTGTPSYDWKVNGITVSTTGTYTPVANDVGRKITVTVSYANQEGILSAQTASVRGTDGVAAITYVFSPGEHSNIQQLTAERGGSMIARGAPQTVIETVRNDAKGADVKLQFGSNQSFGGNFTLDNVGGSWGEISLTGGLNIQINNTIAEGIIIGSGVSVTSDLSISHGGWGGSYTLPIRNRGTLTITGGTLVGGSNNNNNPSITNEGTVILGGNPTINGRIQTAMGALGVVREGSNVLNTTRTYAINFSGTATQGLLAVQNGAGFAGRFTLVAPTNASLRDVGNNLAFRLTSYNTALNGTAGISNAAPRIGDVLTATLTGGNNTGNLTYAWNAGGSAVGTAQTYTVQNADLGKTITVAIGSTMETDTRTSAATAAVLKKLGPSAPDAPVLVTKTHVSITLAAGYEYSMNGGAWTTNNVFSGLTPETEYSFIQRVAGDDYTEESGESVPETITTDVAPPLSGDIVIANSNGNETPCVGDVLTAGLENSNNTGTLTYAWSGGSTGNTYTVTEDDLGSQIALTITSSVEKESLGITLEAVKYPDITGVATIASSGNVNAPRINDVLTASLENGPSGATLSYDWKVGGESKGTSATYKIATEDLGETITVVISADKYFGEVESEATGIVSYPALGGTIAIVGDAVVGQTLEVDEDGLADVHGALSYDWKVGDESKGSDATYEIAAEDFGAIITVTVTAANQAGSVSSATEAVVYPALSGTISIVGNAVVGQELAIRNNLANAYGALSYEWVVGDESKGSSATYTIAAEDFGKTITVTITAAYQTGSASAGTSEVTYPDLSGTIAIAGDAVVGQTLSITESLADAYGALSYDWVVGRDSKGTSATYAIAAEDFGAIITVTITAANQDGFVSAQTSAVVYPALGGTIAIVGDAVVGQTLSADIKGLADVYGALSYEWKAGDDVVGGNENLYEIAAEDFGKTITVTITAEDQDGSVVSDPTTKVLYPAFTGTVAIDNTNPVVGQTIRATAQLENAYGAAIYEWKVGGESKGTGATYTVAAGDFGEIITVTVTVADQAGSVSSATSAVVYPALGGTISIVGNAVVGQELTIRNDLADAYGALSYDWKVGGESKGSSATYEIAAGDFDKTITVTVTAADQTGSVVSSATSAVVYPALGGIVAITGDAVVGQTLSANIDGLEDVYSALSYDWKVDGLSKGTSATYTIAEKDFGATITVTITAADQTGSVVSSATSAVAYPALGGVVAIVGDAVIDQTLSADIKGLADVYSALSYEWKVDGESKGSNATYTIVAGDFGKTITVTITAADQTGSVVSDPTAAVLYPALVGTVAIEGDVVVGQTLATTERLENAYGDLSYEWKVGGVSKGTGETYIVAAGDFGKTITVTVTAEGQAGSVVSLETDAVVYPALGGVVAIVGDVVAGQTLEVDETGLENAYGALSYEWKANGEVVGNDATYMIAAGDFGKTITVTVTAADQDGEVESSATDEATYPELAGVVSIDGEAAVGATLTVNTTGLNAYGTLSYEWMIDGDVVGNESSYKIDAADLGKTITVKVIAENQGDGIESEATPEVGKKTAPSAPAAPTVASKTATSITLTAIAGYEYSMNGGEWTTNNVFDGLGVGMTYNFRQRIAETEDSQASLPSEALSEGTETQVSIGKPSFANANISISVNGDNLHVQAMRSVQVSIYSLKGSVLLSRTVAPNEAVSIAHLPKGMYMVNAGGKTFKLVK